MLTAQPGRMLLMMVVAGAAFAGETGEHLLIKVDGRELVTYQAKPMSNPAGGDKFKGSNFIHPLKTPSGFVVTDSQPADHLHHFGLWWPWKYVGTDNRKVLCWELQQNDGIIEAKESALTDGGFTAGSVYTDRKVPGGPKALLHETLNVNLSEITDTPASGYFMDLEIVHEIPGKTPLTIHAHHYSGFAIRAARSWNRDNSTLLTSEGKNRDDSNTTCARWVRLEGDAGEKKTAGVLLMSRPDNPRHPEHLRTWDSKTHNGALFINFNPVQEEPLRIEPGKKLTRNYRVFVYDGMLSAEAAEVLWKEYAQTK
jgi:hypothetical protein